MDKKELYNKVLKKWGLEAQLDMLVEECAELIVAVNHMRRIRIITDNVFEECADVSILIEQMEQFYKTNRIMGWKKLKLRRLETYFKENDYGTTKSEIRKKTGIRKK